MNAASSNVCGTAGAGYDCRGNLTADGVRTYAYDLENHLLSMSGSPATALAYDPLGRLKTLTEGAAATALLYDGDRLVAEYSASGTLLRRYVHGPGLDEPLVWYEGSGTSERRWLHADNQGSIIAWSDGAGAAQATYAYGPYGEPGGGVWTGSRFRYTGQISLGAARLYHYKARAYDPARGWFLQTDPIGYEDDYNLYRYVANDPVNKSDPTGLFNAGIWGDCNDDPLCKTVGAPAEGGSDAREPKSEQRPSAPSRSSENFWHRVGIFINGPSARAALTVNTNLIRYMAERHGVDPNLISAIIYEEQTKKLPFLFEEVLDSTIGHTVGLGQVTSGYYERPKNVMNNDFVNVEVMAIHLSNIQKSALIDPDHPIASVGTKYNCGSCSSITDYGRRIELYWGNLGK